MSYRQDWVNLIRQLARKYGVDPRAALAVASAEGLGGGVGDQGTSFGPFQLHRGGALPSGRDRAWAESPEGIDYALRQIAGVAKGLQGRPAIESIVRRFERPADPSGEIERAWGAYGSFGGGAEPIGAQPTRAPSFRPLTDAELAGLNQSFRVKAPRFGRMPTPEVPAARPRQAAQQRVTVSAPAKGSEFSMVDPEGAPAANGTRYHAGYDWMLGANKAVPALVGGTVIEVRPSRGSSGQVYGGTVKIETPDGQVLVFRHVLPTVRVGQPIRPGQQVAKVVRWRDNPHSSHAHVELWKTAGGGYRYENMIDPLPLIVGYS